METRGEPSPFMSGAGLQVSAYSAFPVPDLPLSNIGYDPALFIISLPWCEISYE
jgi:hypothetical protein